MGMFCLLLFQGLRIVLSFAAKFDQGKLVSVVAGKEYRKEIVKGWLKHSLRIVNLVLGFSINDMVSTRLKVIDSGLTLGNHFYA